MNYGLHPEVYGDLEAIHDQFELFNPVKAGRILDELLDAFDLIAQFPNHGYRRPDLTSHLIRFKVVRKYLIAYLPDLQPLWIVAVFDGRRNPQVIAAMLRERHEA